MQLIPPPPDGDALLISPQTLGIHHPYHPLTHVSVYPCLGWTKQCRRIRPAVIHSKRGTLHATYTTPSRRGRTSHITPSLIYLSILRDAPPISPPHPCICLSMSRLNKAMRMYSPNSYPQLMGFAPCSLSHPTRGAHHSYYPRLWDASLISPLTYVSMSRLNKAMQTYSPSSYPQQMGCAPCNLQSVLKLE